MCENVCLCVNFGFLPGKSRPRLNLFPSTVQKVTQFSADILQSLIIFPAELWKSLTKLPSNYLLSCVCWTSSGRKILIEKRQLKGGGWSHSSKWLIFLKILLYWSLIFNLKKNLQCFSLFSIFLHFQKSFDAFYYCICRGCTWTWVVSSTPCAIIARRPFICLPAFGAH